MRMKIFSYKKETEKRACYLCEASIKDYILSIPHDYKDFDIQRGIVSNIYLDNLPRTILLGQHMPPITLSTESQVEFIGNTQQNYQISDFKVLDGLQRTHRLKILWESVILLEELLYSETDLFNLDSYQLSKKYNNKFEEIGTDGKSFYSLVTYLKEELSEDISLMKSKFDNIQWFEVWTNLEPDDELQKILILNAGHKQMTTQHQIELLFLNQLKILERVIKEEGYEFVVVRERDMSSTIYGKQRKKGMYYFPHLISSILSFINKKPVTSNVNLIKKVQYNENIFTEFNNSINYEYMKNFTKFLAKFDDYLSIKYNDNGVKWIAKDTVMTGIFGAIGKYSEATSMDSDKIFNNILDSLYSSNEDILNLDEFNKNRNSINLGNVNIGNHTKNSVFEGFLSLLACNFSEKIDWNIYFEGGR